MWHNEGMSDPQYDADKKKLEEERKHDEALAEQRRKVKVEAEHRAHITQVRIEIEKIEREIQRKELDLRALRTEAQDTVREHDKALGGLTHTSTAPRAQTEEDRAVRELRRKLDTLKEEVRETEEEIHKHEEALEDAKQRGQQEHADTMHLQQVAHTTELRSEDLRRRSNDLQKTIDELKRKVSSLSQELRK